MLDRYWFGPCSRISPEAPVPVVRISDHDDRAGGAANVAINLASLGVKTLLLGITGSDDAASNLEELLADRNVDCDFLRCDDVPTTTKLRVISRNQQLLRMDFEQRPHVRHSGELASRLGDAFPDEGVVVFSDYAKGALDEVAAMIELCRERGLPVIVDPKGVDFAKYTGATALTPNVAEFEAVVGPCADLADMESKGCALCERLELDFILLTRSEHGMTLIKAEGEVLHLAAQAREVFDVTGAGDTVIAVLAAGLAAGQSPDEAAALSNLAAGLVVGKLGVASVTTDELRLALHQHGKGGRQIVTRELLARRVAKAQERGETVVMTNGCFDILHAGHVAYLEEAKTLGDRLIIAVNDDASVTRLKGEGRPVNALEDRMAVLAGLAAVDWVVSFSEDTPADLVEAVGPDLLVKGGDYRPEDVAGGDFVKGRGGQVRVLPYVEGRSTSRIIDSIRGD